jgi:uncharacterized protein (DUF2249 family)
VPDEKAIIDALSVRRTDEGAVIVTNVSPESDVGIVDVRSLVPAQRHARIFQLVNELVPGGRFILINDHDPKPLYYQLEAEYPQQFSWTYLKRGPQEWQVAIGRLTKAG